MVKAAGAALSSSPGRNDVAPREKPLLKVKWLEYCGILPQPINRIEKEIKIWHNHQMFLPPIKNQQGSSCREAQAKESGLGRPMQRNGMYRRIARLIKYIARRRMLEIAAYGEIVVTRPW